MSVTILRDGRRKVIHHYRRPDGTKTSVSKILPQHADQRLLLRTKIELMESVEGRGSLTVETYKHISERYRKERGDGGDPWRFRALEDALGTRPVDRRFAFHYQRYIESLSHLSGNTAANHKSIVQRVLTYAYRQGWIEEVPIRDWDIHRTFRDRVWTEDERTRIYNALEELESPLAWLIRFMSARPIRWQSDARNLTTENLVVLGPDAQRMGPHIRFVAHKTGKRKPRPTYLPLFDRRTREPFDPELYAYLCGRPAGELLFPNRHGRAWNNLNHPGGKKRKVGEWRAVLDKAEVADFHLHDLKHVALTRMLRDERYSTWDLKDLGIQYSQKAIEVYYNSNAEAALQKAYGKAAEA